ncbi:MAG TPA: serine hydrolase domain-containing protein [Vicinamibacterales bacterium]|nr:serine hydrolase domain-containing protein [Vicinamibacterales bacterium]
MSTTKQLSPDDHISRTIQTYVDAGTLAGAATLVWRDEAVVHRSTTGCRDLETGLPVARDTIFRIASMTKPITTVAALTLLDEGHFALDTPIAREAPELAHLRVLRDPDGPLDDTVDAERPITFGDLLTHRSGLTYAEFHRGPVGRAYATALGATIDNPLSPDEWIERLATVPLIDQPGHGFHYGHSTDLLGFLIARMERTTLGELLERRIFAPLGMRDTGFVVAESQRTRCAGLCGFDDSGALTALAETPGGHALKVRPGDMTFESGGQGLWSTVDDYLAFARLFVDRGFVNGRRLLRSETLAMMTSNQLTPRQRATARMFGQPAFAEGHGYGMGVASVTEPDKAPALRCRGGVGTIGWPGAYGSWWQVDPTDGSILIFMSHNMAQLHQMARGIGLDVWGAIGEFHAVATAMLGSPLTR